MSRGESDIFDTDEFDRLDITPAPPVTDPRICPECGGVLAPAPGSVRCVDCGLDIQSTDAQPGYNSTAENYNAATNAPMSIRIVGEGAYRYNKSLYRTSSDGAKVQRNTTERQLMRYNAQATEGKLPVIVIKQAAELYSTMQESGIIRRGEGRSATLGACLSFVCIEHKITKKPKTIAMLVGVPETKLSRADKLLRRLHTAHTIDIPVHHDPTDAFISQYFEALRIDEKHRGAIVEIVERISQPDARGDNNSRPSTRCAGCIYMIAIQVPLPITKDQIQKCCSISKSTFTNYDKILRRNWRIIDPVLAKHGIPLLRPPAAE